MRLDLGRNNDFLNELVFIHLVNTFLTYCSDILAVAALESPEKFSFKLNIDSSALVKAEGIETLHYELGIAVLQHISLMPYPVLRKLLLSKLHLKNARELRRIKLIDDSVEKETDSPLALGHQESSDRSSQDRELARV